MKTENNIILMVLHYCYIVEYLNPPHDISIASKCTLHRQSPSKICVSNFDTATVNL